MNGNLPDPNNPVPTPGNPYPEPARPSTPPEAPQPVDAPGIPPPTPDPIPSPGEEPVQVPPGTPPEIPGQPSFPAPTAARLVALAAVLLCWPASLAMAQTSDGPGTSGGATIPCQVDPGGDQENPSGGDARPSLEECNGVLVPPVIGDQEIVEPPPNTGTTPVIPPGSLPQQPTDQNPQ